MKMTKVQMERLVRRVFQDLKQNTMVTFKVSEEKAFQKAISIIEAEYEKEKDIEREAHKMVDQLEKSNAGEFERHKMFMMIKKKLAKDRGVVL